MWPGESVTTRCATVPLRILAVDHPGGLLQRGYRVLWQLAGCIGREVEQQVGIAVHALTIILRDDFRRLHLEAWPPEPAVHRRHGFVGRPGRNPAFKGHVVLLAFKGDMRIVSPWRRQAIFAVDDVGGPAGRLTDSALVALAL